MIKTIKKILAIITVCILVLGVFSLNTAALSGSTSISVSSESPKVGTTLIVTSSFSLDGDAMAMGQLQYDSSKLKYITSSPAGETNKISDGTVLFVTDDLATSHYFRVEFEVIAEGDTTLQLAECSASDVDEVTVSGFSKTVSLKSAQSSVENPPQSSSSQDTTKNTSAALSSITVSGGTLSPAFKANITEYTVVVPYTHTDGIISCDAADPNAKISVQGSRELKVGLNKRTIVVTASNGDVRRYTVTFNRLDENGKDTTIPEEEIIAATVNGKEFKVSQADASVVPPKGFNLTTATYKGQEIAVYADDSGKTVIAYLEALDDSEKGFYIFQNDTFSVFNYIECNDKVYIVSEGQVAPEELYKSECEIGGKNIPCYKYTSEEYADFVIIFAKTTDGAEGYYRYDTKEGTLQRYPEFNGEAEDASGNLSVTSSKRIVIIVLSAVFVLGILALIVLAIVKIVLNVKKRKSEQENFSHTEE